MAGSKGMYKKERRFIKRIKDYDDKIMLAPRDAVMEGFEYFETDTYLRKKDSVNRAINMLKMLTGYGRRQFAKTALAMGTNMKNLIKYIGKNYDDVESLVKHLEEHGEFPVQSSELIAAYPNIEIWNQLKAYAWEKHKVRIGFTSMTEDMIFQGKAIPFSYALVCIQEMNKDAFEEEPIVAAGREVVRVYNTLGQATNDIAKWLREEFGINCMANHPFGGLVDFVPLAEKAGLGRMGHNGLLIAPEYGTRHRISPIFIQEELFADTNTLEFEWIDGFCMSCRACERICPTGAIYPEPIIDKERAFGGRPRARTIDKEKCFQYFSITLGCSECIRTCPFVNIPYDKVKEGWNRKLAKKKTKESINELNISNIKYKEPKNIAIVGAGPSGLYAAERVLGKTENTKIDLIEKLPVPFGLVRYGVAPDHLEVKSKIFYFQDIIRDKRIEFFGNISLGKNVSLEELQSNYDAVIISTGASKGRKMGIQGEMLSGSITAPDFVNWYNGHPEFQDIDLPNKAKSIAVIGLGNVSLDVSRMIIKDSRNLERTNITDEALGLIKGMKTKEIHIFGRRGPYEAKFTPKELLELIELPNASVEVEGWDFPINHPINDKASQKAMENYDLFRRINDGEFTKKSSSAIKLIFHFMKSPTCIQGKDKVQAIQLEIMKIEHGVLKGTGKIDTFQSDLVISSIGYKSEHISGLNSQDKNGIITNKKGAILDEKGQEIPGLYCTGWIRRGPSGVIGTNKIDAIEVVDYLLESCFESKEEPSDIRDRMKEKAVLKEQMNEILMIERMYGSWKHKKAKKYTKVDDMLMIESPKTEEVI